MLIRNHRRTSCLDILTLKILTMANGFVDGVGGSDGRKVGGAVGDLDCLNESVFSDVGNIVGRKEGRKEGRIK
jgi:hypothetical protein